MTAFCYKLVDGYLRQY